MPPSTSTNLDPLFATLTIATIDDLTGTITNSPHTTAHGTLDLTSSIALNNQIIKKFQAATSAGSPSLKVIRNAYLNNWSSAEII